MKIDFFKTDETSDFTPARLFCVYIIDADKSYKGIKGVSKERKGYAAVRTVSGCGSMDISGKKNILLPAGSLFIVPAWKLITYRPKDDHWKFRWFEFEAGQSVIEEEKIHIMPVKTGELSLLDHIFETISRGGNSDLEAASALFTSMLYLWKGMIDLNDRVITEDKLSAVAEMIRRDPQTDHNVEDLARQCALSVRRFREVFERKFGVPPKKYILRIKMERAYELLISTDISVSATAESVGFKDGLYFSRAFKNYFGSTPSSIRKSKNR